MFPVQLRDDGPHSWAVLLTVTAADAAACKTNTQSDVITNYKHCVEWYNNTGVGKVGAVLDSCTLAFIESVYIFAGSTFKRCYTNSCPTAPYLSIRPYQGAPLDEYEIVDYNSSTTTPFTTLGSPATPGVNDNGSQNGPINPGVTNVPSVGTNQVNQWTGTTATNAVVYGLTNWGSASQSDTLRAAAAIINAITTALADVRDAIQRAAAQAHADATNGTGGGLNDSGITNSVNAARQAITNAIASAAGQAHIDATNIYTALTNLEQAAWGTNGITTNSFGSTWESAGSALSSSANSSWLSSGSNAAAWSGSNSPSGTEAALEFTLPVGGEVLDLRPSSWSSNLSAIYAVVKAVFSVFILWMFYAAIWDWFQRGYDNLNVVTAGVGKTLTGATLAGGTAGQALRVTVASIITVGLAGLPALMFGVLSNTGATGSVSTSILTVVQNTATAVSPAVGSGVATVWVWFDRMVPWVLLVASIANYYAFRVSMLAFMSVWLTVYRLLPVLVAGLFLWALDCQAAAVIVDNRLHVPVGILTADGLEWYDIGERKTVLPSDWYITSSQGTNGMHFYASEGEWTRFVVYESTTNSIAAYSYAESGFKTGFNRGMVASFGLGALWLAVNLGKRVLKSGGVYSE